MSNNIHTTLTKLRDLLRRVGQLGLPAEDEAVFRGLLSKEVARCERRQAKAVAKAAAGEQAASDADEAFLDAEAEEEEEGARREASGHDMDPARRDPSAGPPNCPSGSAAAETGPERKGHGRNGAGKYVNAQHIYHVLLSGVIGAICEACGIGRMSRYREKLIVAIKGQPLFDAAVHHFEQARCKLCGAIIRAEGLAVAEQGLGSSYITYEWSACAMLAVMHYFAGLPFKRIESLQAGWGIPMPDANQWTLADQSAELLLPLYRALERYGVRNATALRIDDTGSMVISLQREIRAEMAVLEELGESTNDVRTGINATGVYLETEQGKVLLFFTGRHHAGEIIDRILTHRSTAEFNRDRKLVKVSDAASKNFSHAHRDDLEEAVCNAHAYLKFRAVKDQFPEEHGLAGEVYKQVFDNDDVARAEGMSPHERMLYHRQHSLPEMRRLKKTCSDKLQSKLVEPNSPLWEPLTFIINQWERLTKFCMVPGTPLDTNVVEQMLIIPVRYLAASFNYKSQDGAEVGDLHMSLVGSANANGVEPVAYLTECLANHEDLAKRPEHYLPWAYRSRLEAGERNTQTGPPPAASYQPSRKGRDVEHPLRPGSARRAVGARAGAPFAAASS
ncbi:MAG: IS66 family transposase [Acidobacteria bacterium]|nr:IS66 family transposase [Acidobacteriota bacterium]